VDEQQREVSQRDLHKVPPSLTAAIRVARVENAERSEVVAELRGAELARLEILLEALEPVLAQVPKGVDLFDVGIAPGEHPRLFIDMIGFVEMGRDRRVYRFVQDTRVGRVTITETERLDTMVEALTAYIARRLIERDKTLAADTTSQEAAAAAEGVPAPTAALRGAAAPSEPAVPARRPRRRFFARALLLVIEILGSITLFCIIAAAAYFAYTKAMPWGLAHYGSPL
jgi:hypothetical protein